ncbi:uncharacterized protein BO97DRAFT_28137 [Aspergillus homomorphus CBS 101889]|uniref:Uncharacterized protein n=1 Tax=Aspergillus homomorphus (strain CBS 101889) TaxID=1450537 RepID=A0A395I0Y6_ASPHC|nr:hypothetical protein BO97DRAFT_28137 [Aspergillus homomorphus CBS 101889]RAL13862.1 hypothetical protein BO97DRAFT_28137 [Aspergillus homomorphus CBS 101889]
MDGLASRDVNRYFFLLAFSIFVLSVFSYVFCSILSPRGVGYLDNLFGVSVSYVPVAAVISSTAMMWLCICRFDSGGIRTGSWEADWCVWHARDNINHVQQASLNACVT